MNYDAVEKARLFTDPALIYKAMLEDIASAEKFIYLETYKFAYDKNGEKFRDLLAEKCRQGVQVKVLLDSWGTPPSSTFFLPVTSNGGEVRFFAKIKFFVDFFTRNHRRNHRKLLIVDDRISYLGSANITGYSLKWRESMLRLEGTISPLFRKSFLNSFKLYRKYIFNKFSYRRAIHFKGFEILQDLPSIYRQQVKRRYESLIQKAKHEVIIETPYFLPGFKLRRQMMLAARRGVNVKVIMPLHSDVRLVDFLRDKYMGFYYKNGIKLHFYTPGNLHAKCMLIDNQVFAIGSANFDYRSFRYQHEIVLVGTDPRIQHLIKAHLDETMLNCEGFNMESWLRRPLIQKLFGWLLIPFRHLF